MGQQTSLPVLEYGAKRKQTQQDRSSAEIGAVTPWLKSERITQPFYPIAGERARPPIGLSLMQRVDIAQQCLGLSVDGIGYVLNDSQTICRFFGIGPTREAAPDVPKLVKFRRQLDILQSIEYIFNTINAWLTGKGLLLCGGVIANAALIAAFPSTNTKEGQREHEMHQMKKSKQCHFGMNARACADTQPGLAHTVMVSVSSDVTQVQTLLHGDKNDVVGDADYQGVKKCDDSPELPVRWHLGLRFGERKALKETQLQNLLEWTERTKARIRAKVEHPFYVVKTLFRHHRVSHRGSVKKAARLFSLLDFTNLVSARRWLFDAHTQCAS